MRPRRVDQRLAGRLPAPVFALLRLGLLASMVAGVAVAASGCVGVLGVGDGGAVGVSEPLDDQRLERLALDFYGRLANRRIDSIATYQDPSLREYFRSEDAFADYYADLVQALVDGYFEARRLTAVQIESAESDPDGNGAVLRIRMRGENGRPLRWWSSEVIRDDRWVREDGRWWIEPGKV